MVCVIMEVVFLPLILVMRFVDVEMLLMLGEGEVQKGVDHVSDSVGKCRRRVLQVHRN